MKHYRPLLLQELDLRLPGLHARRLRLNRHLPEVDLLAEHSHPFSQILAYLSGRGTMTVAERNYEISPGSVVFLPPRCTHAFRETSGRRPLCVVLDLDYRGAVKHGFSLARLTQSEATAIKTQLSELTRLPDPNHPGCRLAVPAVVLRLLDILLRGLNLLPSPQRGQTPPFVRQFERLIRESDSPPPPIAELASKMGYQMDYLNRIFKQATGQTLREYRDALFVDRAKRLLRENTRVKDACDHLGFYDQNYFARWFKKHTGVTPRAFSLSGGVPASKP
ncbi:N/A [soil metagenome]